MKKGDQVTIKQDTHAWYSGYGMNPERIILAGEVLTVTSVNVPPVRGTARTPSYNVARTVDGWQISTCEVPFEVVS